MPPEIGVLHPSAIDFFKSKTGELAEQLIYIDDLPLQLERDWQFDFVSSTHSREVVNKARQIGYSYASAIRALIRAHIFPNNTYNAIFVSINREEARNKVRYIEGLLASMKEKKGLVIANKLEIEFTNGNRIVSSPSSPVRGQSNVDLYLDEFAHVRDARDIYAGSTPSTVRQCYGVSVGSTPFGQGIFCDMCKGAGQEGPYRRFVYKEIPWWHSHILCTDVDEARIFAPGMLVEDRVKLYGTDNLKAEFEGMDSESFRQEFEAFLISFGNSALSEDLILSCQDGHLSCSISDIDFENRVLQPDELIRMALQDVESAGELHECFVGYDVGRAVHASELILMDWFGNKLRTRMYLTLRKCPFQDQRRILEMFIDQLPIRKLVIDSQGLGSQLAEELQMKYSTKVEPMSFGENSKSEMVNRLVKAFESKSIVVYPTRRMHRQLQAVRKVFSPTGRILYRSAQEKDESASSSSGKSHADLFWALAMGVYGAQNYLKSDRLNITTRSPRLSISGGNFSGKRLNPDSSRFWRQRG